MKKSEILRALDGSVKSYFMVGEEYLHVIVDKLSWLQLTYITEKIMAIYPSDGGIEVTFDSTVEID